MVKIVQLLVVFLFLFKGTNVMEILIKGRTFILLKVNKKKGENNQKQKKDNTDQEELDNNFVNVNGQVW